MFDFIFENEKAATEEQWQEVKEEVQERLDNWRGEEYHDDTKEYRGEITIDKKVFSFSLHADLTEDSKMIFGSVISVKRVR